MQKAQKVRRRTSIEDVASVTGQSADELKRLLQEKRLQEIAEAGDEGGTLKAEIEREEVEIDDIWADDVPEDPAQGTKRSGDSLEDGIRSIKNRVSILEAVQGELITDTYNNFIRVEIARGTQVREFHQIMGPFNKLMAQKPQIAIIQTSSFHIDYVVKEMGDPREAVDFTKEELRDAKLDSKASAVPPVNPYGNELKQPAKQAYKVLMQVVERKVDGERAGQEYKPKTRWPVAEVGSPSWSMHYGEMTFIRMDYQRTAGTAMCSILPNFRIKDVDITAKEFVDQYRAQWRFPWKLQFVIQNRTSEGIRPAPDFKEVRQARRG